MNFLLLGLFLLLFPDPTFAAGSIIASAVLKLVGFKAFIAAAVINFAVSQIVTRIFAPKLRKPNTTGVREQIPPSSINSLPVVYGDAYLGGMFVDAVLSQDQKVMYYVMAISSISNNGQFSYDTTKFYYGDRLITFDATDKTKVISLTDGNGNVNTKINNRLFINLYTSNAAGVITNINGTLAPHQVMAHDAGDKKTVPAALAWPSTGRQMHSTAFAIVELRYNVDAQVTGLDPITFKCAQYLNNAGVAKPGDVWLDYMTNTEYGGAIDVSFVHTTSAAALNAYSDELITFNNSAGVPTTQPRYRINGVIDTTKPVLENIDQIMIASDSWLSFDGGNGKWAVVINKAESPALSFDDDNIIGDIRVSTMNINQSTNQVEAQFPNKGNKDVPNWVYLKTPSGLLFPNEPVNKLTTSFDLVNDSVQAQYLANRILEQAREDLIVGITTTYYGIQATAGDVVSVTNAAYGWTNKLFRVMKVNEASLEDGSLGAQLELNEYNAQVYDDKDITAFAPSPNSDIPNPAFFSALTAPTISNALPNAAVPSFQVDCVLPTSGQVLFVNLYYTTVASPAITDWQLWGTQVAADSEPFTPGTTVSFPSINLPTAIYYFAFTVGNAVGQSGLSPISAAYNWLPNPSSSAVAGTFVATFSPPVILVPFTTSPQLTGIAPELYGTTAGGSVDFVPAQDDSDALFVNNTWRIGGSSTTGYGDIVKSNITIGNPSDSGFHALWPTPSAMPAEPAYLEVPVRYKDTAGNVSQGATAILELVYSRQGNQGNPGADGTKAGTAYLYQWATSTPANPSGTSDFVWATATNQTYTGGGGWSATVPANPGTPSIKLWQAAKGVSATATATITTVSWSSGFSVSDITQNGAAGTQVANPTVYQWAATIPSGPTGTSTYTWSTGTFSPTPSGWSLTPPASPSPGFTLWAATVRLIEGANVPTSTINWTTATITAAGYAGTNGSAARIMFARIAGAPVPVTGSVTVSGDNRPTGAEGAAVWGASFNVTWNANDPDPSSNNTLWQSDGIFNPTTNQTSWSTPYISNLKVGTLSAITVNTGGLTVSDFIRAGTNPAISGSSMTGNGFTLNSGGTFAIGNSTRNLSFNGSTLTLNGDLVVTGNIQNEAISTPTSAFLANSLTLPNTGQTYVIATTPTLNVPNGASSASVGWSANFWNDSGTRRNVWLYVLRYVNGISSLANFANQSIASNSDQIVTQLVTDTSSILGFASTIYYQLIVVPINGSANLYVFGANSQPPGAGIFVELFKR